VGGKREPPAALGLSTRADGNPPARGVHDCVHASRGATGWPRGVDLTDAQGCPAASPARSRGQDPHWWEGNGSLLPRPGLNPWADRNQPGVRVRDCVHASRGATGWPRGVDLAARFWAGGRPRFALPGPAGARCGRRTPKVAPPHRRPGAGARTHSGGRETGASCRSRPERSGGSQPAGPRGARLCPRFAGGDWLAARRGPGGAFLGVRASTLRAPGSGRREVWTPDGGGFSSRVRPAVFLTPAARRPPPAQLRPAWRRVHQSTLRGGDWLAARRGPGGAFFGRAGVHASRRRGRSPRRVDAQAAGVLIEDPAGSVSDASFAATTRGPVAPAWRRVYDSTLRRVRPAGATSGCDQRAEGRGPQAADRLKAHLPAARH
jgi:hypothetical protein